MVQVVCVCEDLKSDAAQRRNPEEANLKSALINARQKLTLALHTAHLQDSPGSSKPPCFDTDVSETSPAGLFFCAISR